MKKEFEIIALEEETFTTSRNVDDYFEKLKEAVSYRPDIVVGPDYGLCFLDKQKKIRFNLRDKLIHNLEDISKISPDTLVIPGTTPFLLADNYMGHSAMVFQNGKKVKEFMKETDVGDGKIAEENNLIYKEGDSSKNHLNYGGKEIALEICSDHGKQRFEKDPFLELILAYDDRAGFFPRANNDNFARWAVVCDGRKPFAACFRYDPSKGYGIPEGKHLNKSLVRFELDETSVSYF